MRPHNTDKVCVAVVVLAGRQAFSSEACRTHLSRIPDDSFAEFPTLKPRESRGFAEGVAVALLLGNTNKTVIEMMVSGFCFFVQSTTTVTSFGLCLTLKRGCLHWGQKICLCDGKKTCALHPAQPSSRIAPAPVVLNNSLSADLEADLAVGFVSTSSCIPENF